MSDKSSKPADAICRRSSVNALEKKNAHNNAHPGSGTRREGRRRGAQRTAEAPIPAQVGS